MPDPVNVAQKPFIKKAIKKEAPNISGTAGSGEGHICDGTADSWHQTTTGINDKMTVSWQSNILFILFYFCVHFFSLCMTVFNKENKNKVLKKNTFLTVAHAQQTESRFNSAFSI